MIKIATPRVGIPVLYGRTKRGFINIVASRRQYLLNTGKIREWPRLLRAAFVVLQPGERVRSHIKPRPGAYGRPTCTPNHNSFYIIQPRICRNGWGPPTSYSLVKTKIETARKTIA